jgi:hypothetical protein
MWLKLFVLLRMPVSAILLFGYGSLGMGMFGAVAFLGRKSCRSIVLKAG